METFKDRLEQLIEAKKTNPNNLATELGTSPVNIYGYLNGKADLPSARMIKKFEEIGINTDWLLYGKGEMFSLETISKDGGSTSVDYLLTTLKRIEESFRSDIEEKNKIINDQRYIIDVLRSQLQATGNFLEPVIVEPLFQFDSFGNVA